MAEKKKTTKKPNKVAETIKKAVKAPKNIVKPKPFEERTDLQKLYIFVIVVEQSVANTVLKFLLNLGSSAQFVHNGRGTAPSEVLGMLNATDDRKAIINAFVSEDRLPEIREELNIFLRTSRKNRGIAFAIPLSSIQGIRMYKYLTQTF